MPILIFANGVIAQPAKLATRYAQPGDLILAADGGTRHALAAGLTPQHIIGDLDSFPADLRAHLEAQGTTFHPHPPAKDATDLELALLWAAEASSIQHPASSIVILGALGGRPDQALANLLLLTLPQLAGRDVVIADEGWEIRCLRGGETLRLRGRPGDTLSLLPLGGPAVGVTTAGLAYPLRGETLHFGPARGVSNVFAADIATISLAAGWLWCFHQG